MQKMIHFAALLVLCLCSTCSAFAHHTKFSRTVWKQTDAHIDTDWRTTVTDKERNEKIEVFIMEFGDEVIVEFTTQCNKKFKDDRFQKIRIQSGRTFINVTGCAPNERPRYAFHEWRDRLYTMMTLGEPPKRVSRLVDRFTWMQTN